MTRCEWDPSRVHSYIDNELAPEEALECERHLLECVDCRATYEKVRAVVDVVRGARPLYETPERSRTATRALLVESGWRRPIHLASSVGAVAALCLIAVVLVTRPASASFDDFAVRSHRLLAPSATDLEIRTSNPDTVSQWLAQRVSFRPGLPAHTPAPQDRYTLIGAKILRHNSRDVAYLRYQLDNKPVSLLIATAGTVTTSGGEIMRSGSLDFRFHSRDSLDLITWTDKGVDYCLISENAQRKAGSCIVCHPSSSERYLIDNLRRRGLI